jgi:hypothetical protein
MAKHTAIWRKQPSKEDFDAVLHYLSLQLPPFGPPFTPGSTDVCHSRRLFHCSLETLRE